ncbi:MFS transporter [Embleya hyalina]|uniref:MFS transporter n=1 Tax=Embleya hyalina TaxID=516124 RepID=A0A401Z6J2_9ACTN|nr:MFS transporter [Embleya hyalina]GCE02480.1 MFS transporter [Embleya hyalina]
MANSPGRPDAAPPLAKPAPRPTRPARRDVIALVACVAQFMVVLDSTIVTVALPDLRTSLDLSDTGQQWVVNAYLITLGGLLVVAARAGDLFGRKTVFQTGLLVFTAAGVLGGVAQDTTTLLVARVAQGLGAAALASNGLSLIAAGYAHDPIRRGRALTLWSLTGGVAAAAGLVLGGVLTQQFGWRWVFLVNAPVGVALLLTAGLGLAPTPAADPGERRRIDVGGALAVTGATGLFGYAVSRTTTHSWTSPGVLGTFAGAALCTVAFVLIERTAARPLVPLKMWRLPALRFGNLMMLVLGSAMTATLYFMSLYLQGILGYGALRAGGAMVPLTVTMLASGMAAHRLIAVLGPRALLAGGAVTAAVGVLFLAWLPADGGFPVRFLIGSVVAGAGVGLMLLPVTVAATAGIEARDAGAASGLLNTARQLGGALGLAVLVTVAAQDSATDPAAVLDGYHTAFAVDGFLILLVVPLALLLPRPPRP